MNEDEIMRDLLNVSATEVVIDDSPTILSLQDSTSVIEKKFGKDWVSNIFAKRIVIWQSRIFERSHVKEVCAPYEGLHELCEEFYQFETINGEPLPNDFAFQVLNFMMSFLPVEERVTFRSSPVKDAYWIIEK